MSQTEQLLARLRRGPIMTVAAIDELGILALSQRVTDLRKAGHSIETEMVEVEKRDGTTARVARYHLRAEAVLA